MNLRLAVVIAARPTDCTLRWIDQPEELPARYSAAVEGRIRICPGQLVAVDVDTAPPSVMWRWFRGVVIYRRDAYVVVDNHVYQPGLRFPISVVWLPDILEVEVQVGDVVFYGLETHGAVIDVVRDDRPAHPARVAADLFPVIADVYAEIHAQGEA
jgi:hypothetical protein